MFSIFFIAVLLSAVGSGIMAGLFFIFSNTIMKALSKLPPPQGIASMQSINKVILNPLFFLVFFGTTILSLILAISMIWTWGEPGAIFVLIGALVYFIGMFLVTVVFNVPMNKALDTVMPDTVEASDLWSNYLTKWTAWNHVRTIACVFSTVSYILAIV